MGGLQTEKPGVQNPMRMLFETKKFGTEGNRPTFEKPARPAAEEWSLLRGYLTARRISAGTEPSPPRWSLLGPAETAARIQDAMSEERHRHFLTEESEGRPWASWLTSRMDIPGAREGLAELKSLVVPEGEHRRVEERVLLDLFFIWSRLLRVLHPSPARSWMVSHNDYLGAQPIEALRRGRTAEVVAAVDNQEQGTI